MAIEQGGMVADNNEGVTSQKNIVRSRRKNFLSRSSQKALSVLHTKFLDNPTTLSIINIQSYIEWLVVRLLYHPKLSHYRAHLDTRDIFSSLDGLIDAGWKIYPRAIIMNSDGRFLLVKREYEENDQGKEKPMSGKREFPGGSVDEGATTFDTLIKEVEEEVNLVIDKSMITRFAGSYPKHKRWRLHAYFTIETHIQHEIELSDEHTDSSRITREDLKEAIKKSPNNYTSGTQYIVTRQQ